MPIQIRKNDGESTGSFLYRFSKRVQQAGVLKEAKRRRFRSRSVNKRQRRISALYRNKKGEETRKAKKMGLL